MESVAIFGETLSNKSIVKNFGAFTIDANKLMVGLIEEEDIELPKGAGFDDFVLVKKIAFSCNYRDRPLISYINSKVIEGSETGDLFYSHFGSEFVGEVLQIGKDVKSLVVGDRVIPNISYPSYSKGYRGGIPSNGSSKRQEIFKSNNLLKAPAQLSNETLAAFSISSLTAYSMIRKTVKAGDKVLITAGRSNTSLSAICALSSYNVEVSVITSSAGIEKYFYDLGVKNVFVVDSKVGIMNDDALIHEINAAGKFNVIIDPYFDVYLTKLLQFMDYDSKYITCGMANQSGYKYNLNEEVNFRSLMINLMIGNISLIGNCIGLIEDYSKALNDYKNENYKIIIDSTYTKGEENSFLDRTYNTKDRFGKVVYLYE